MRSDAIQSAPIEALKATFPTPQPADTRTSFGDELKNSLEQVVSLQSEAADAASKATQGGAEHIHETMIKMEEADLSLRLLAKVRTKALDAYQEIMRMQF